MFFLLALLSLAGLPLTAGFMAKFYLVLAGVRSGLWLLAFSLVINSVISLYYYLRVIKTMFTKHERRSFEISTVMNFVLFIITIGILFLGILPSYIIKILLAFNTIN